MIYVLSLIYNKEVSYNEWKLEISLTPWNYLFNQTDASISLDYT